MINIYGLIDPRTNELRYVGKTVHSLTNRLRKHVGRANMHSPRYSSRWIAGVLASGSKPDIFEIEILPDDADWQDAEQFWIQYFRSIGCRLTNLSTGGEGRSGVVFTDEQREAARKRYIGRIFDDEWKRKISEAKRGIPGKKQSAETVARRNQSIKKTVAARRAQRVECRHGHSGDDLYASASGIPQCRACKKAYYERTKILKPTPDQHPLKGRTLPPEWRAKLSLSAKRRASDPVWRANHSATMKQLAAQRKGKT